MDDTEITELFLQRKESAIKELSQKYGSYCKTVASNILKNPNDTEECLNDAYLAVWNTTSAIIIFRVQSATIVSRKTRVTPYSYQCVIDLYGDLNSTATAEKLYDSDGEVRAIKITLDREYCEGLFGIEPCIKGSSNSEKNFDDDRACFILTEKKKDYYKVLNSLNDRDSVRVSLSAKEFSLSYHYETGYTYDGMTLLDFDDDSYTLEILD